MNNQKKFLNLAITEARKASKKYEVPVGAVIEKDGKVVAKAHNLIETNYDSTAHAEILAIREAGKRLKNWRLSGASIYVTVEPCPVCKNAIVQSRVSRVFFGCRTNEKVTHNNKIEYIGPLMQERCSGLMEIFFKNVRKKITRVDHCRISAKSEVIKS